jgi:proline-specific peptidase
MANKYVKTVGNNRIYYRIKKKGGPFLIFLHGWPLNHTTWLKELKYFEKKKYSTIAIDLRGHGKSSKPNHPKSYTFNKFAKDIETIIKKEEVTEFILVGHSFGGMIALSYFSLFPEKPSALILIDTIYENPLKHTDEIEYKELKKHPHLTRFSRFMFEYIMENQKIQEKQFPYIDFSKLEKRDDFYYWVTGAKTTPPKSVLICLQKMIKFNKKRILSKINIPTLVLEGDQDTKTAVKDVREMAKKIKDSKFVLIKNATHDTPIQNSKQVNKEISKFLKDITYKYNIPE